MKIFTKVLPWFYTNSQNLGQKYDATGISKYKSTNEKGNPTGIGYAFEDYTKIKWENQGHKVEQVPTKINGADFILDGKPCQLKCGYKPSVTGSSFYEKPHGHYKYKGQTAVIPKGQKKEVCKIFRICDKKGLGRPENVIESPVTRKEAEAYGTRGLLSLKMDISDKNLRNPSLVIGTIVALTGGATELIAKEVKGENINTEECLKTISKWLQRGLVSSLAVCSFECVRRQILRPSHIC